MTDADVGKAGNNPQPGTSSQADPVEEAAKLRANHLILEAERYKAAVNSPPGMEIDHNQIPPELSVGCQVQGVLDDDEFFHVSCHVDDSLKNKIERGQFVDLEKLLPRSRINPGGFDDTEMKLVFREGRSFFVPVQSQNKINSVRRWEQAFRIYAAIYSQANPSRSSEIWQYVHVINVAASTYLWDNVASYDITFRHLMAQNPSRSWSKIYNQMWNLSMRHVIPRNGSGSNQSNAGQSFSVDHNRRNSGGATGGNVNNNNAPRKPKYCWAYNRGSCKDGNKCKYVNRCSYCDAGDHGKNTCSKIARN